MKRIPNSLLSSTAQSRGAFLTFFGGGGGSLLHCPRKGKKGKTLKKKVEINVIAETETFFPFLSFSFVCAVQCCNWRALRTPLGFFCLVAGC